MTWTTADFVDPKTGNTIPAGQAVIQAALLSLGSKSGGISIPNATALFLNLSKTHLDAANACIASCQKSTDLHGHFPEVDSFGAIEHYMASVIFACTALEALANELIPDTYVHTVTKKGVDHTYTKEEIERRFGPKEKLGDVLPNAIRVATPKGSALWQACRDLFDLRDRIIHMKTADRLFQGDARTAKSLWNEVLQDPLPDTYKVATAIINHFFNAMGKKPRWFEKLPF